MLCVVYFTKYGTNTFITVCKTHFMVSFASSLTCAAGAAGVAMACRNLAPTLSWSRAGACPNSDAPCSWWQAWPGSSGCSACWLQLGRNASPAWDPNSGSALAVVEASCAGSPWTGCADRSCRHCPRCGSWTQLRVGAVPWAVVRWTWFGLMESSWYPAIIIYLHYTNWFSMEGKQYNKHKKFTKKY